jgi:membrane-bound lytic murein transglycosylase B
MYLSMHHIAGFHAYAVDWDGDGHRDIWGSAADSLASIANYLRENGWRR